MRLICPNCDAQYEVDDGAVPVEGRDVQCSNCGHAWFQTHAMALAEAEDDAGLSAMPAPMPVQPAQTEPAAQPVAAVAPALVAHPEPADPDPADREPVASVPVAAALPVRRTLDENLLTVLREEAARAAAERRADPPRALETQPDLGLPEAGRRVAGAMTGAPVAVTSPTLSDPIPDHPVTERPNPRRDLLPDIEEINSTLRPGSDARDDEGAIMLPPPPSRSGFRGGFGAVLLVAGVLVGLYVLAPQIGRTVPSMQGAMTSYVASVDALRMWLDNTMNAAAGALRNLTGEG